MKPKIEKTRLLMINKFVKSLSGSGIDSNWKVLPNSKSIRVNNSFHCLNQFGFYDGYQDFEIIFFNDKPMLDFRLLFTGYDRYLAYKHNLRPYLEELISNTVEELK